MPITGLEYTLGGMALNMFTRKLFARQAGSTTTQQGPISVSEVAEALEQGSVLLDVRDDIEWVAGHAPDAIHIPLQHLDRAASRLEGKDVLTICRSGRRSSQAAAALKRAGLSARNVSGGMKSWASAGLPVVREGGKEGTVL